MGYLDYAGLQYLWGKLKEKFAPKSHSHDDRYYTEAEMDGKLNSKSNTNHTHDASTLINALGTGAAAPTDPDYIITQWVGGGTSNTTWVRRPMSSIWNYIKGKADGVYQPKGSYAASGHTHDDRYYTESEMNTKLSVKAENIVLAHNANLDNVITPGFYSCGGGNSISNKPTGTDAIGLIVTHNASGNFYTQILTTSSNANTYRRTCLNGSWSGWTQDKYTDTNTWRGIQNNLTSDSTSDSLSAAQGKVLKGLVNSKANSSHTHTKSQITDFPASLKNPTALTIQTNGTTATTYDGSAAKTVNITKSNIGLGNVDNTSDASKSVKYATSAGSASNATKATSADSAGKLTMGDAQTALSGTASPTAGLTVNKVYGNGYPTTYGNVITVHGSGSGQIVAGWSGTSGAVERLYYRNKRDTSDANWSSWKTVAFTDDKPATAGTADVANSVDWSKVQNKPSSYPPASHSHAYLPLIGGTMSGQITKSTGGSWIGDRDRAAIKSSYAGDSSYGAVAAMATKNGYWTMGNLGGNESLIFNYSTDAKYNAGKNETSQVYLPAQAGTIITSATIGSQSVNYANSASTANVANSVDWSKVQNKPSSYVPASHTHDDRYYTESEVNTKLANYQPKGNYAAASHTHNYAGSGIAGGSANSAIKLDSSAGSAIQPVYFKDGKPVATTYTLNKTVPADAKFTDTNTWRGIQNNLTSDSTDQSLSAAQGKALKALVDGKAPASHTHKKSQITDFPSSMPASDVYAWAKAATKPTYTKAEVGLGNVDNTADKDKSVKYAASAGSASQLNGFTIQASTSDLTAGYSRLNNNVIYIVYE